MNRVKNTFSSLIVNRFGIHFTNLTSSFYLPLKISLLPKKTKKQKKTPQSLRYNFILFIYGSHFILRLEIFHIFKRNFPFKFRR